jgi:CheY-like chemotaxis protein
VLDKKEPMPHTRGHTAKESSCLPFFHPTRIVFIDDELGFIRYFSGGLNLNVPISCYASPHRLLADITAGTLETSINLDCWSSYTGRFADPQHEHMLSLDKTMLMMRVFARNRFDPVSVFVVDYAMPEMNGLELCRRLSHLPARKILLTGQAGVEQAVEAFNEGLIDCYVSKGTATTKPLLREHIQRFQRAFIADATGLVRQALRTETFTTWDEPDFCALFAYLRRAHGIVEYYAISDPAEGFMLVNDQGRGRLLLTYSDAVLDAQFATARLSGAPPDVCEALRQRRAGTFFADEESNRALDATAWRLACVPVHPFPTRPERYYALLDTSEPFDVSPQTVLGLRRFLAEQD